MKKKFLAVVLAAVMTLGVLPVMAFAEETDSLTPLAAPEKVRWGGYNRVDGTEMNVPGIMSCYVDGPFQGKIKYSVYKVVEGGNDKLLRYNTVSSSSSSDSSKYHNAFLVIVEWDDVLEDGSTYYFTAQSIGDRVNYSNSEEVKSDFWSYEEPVKITEDKVSVHWEWPQAVVELETSGTTSRGYDVNFYYSETEGGELQKAQGFNSYDISEGFVNSSKSYTISDRMIKKYGAGYYYFTFRVLSSDLSRYNNGPEELSPAYYLAPNISDALNDIKENQTSPEDIREQVQKLDTQDLRDAMLADNDGTGVIQKMKELEEATGTNLQISVNDGMEDKIPQEDVEITGALLNNVNLETVTLNIGEPKNANDVIPAQYNNTVAVNFSMELDGVENPDKLEVPVKLVIPIPEGINPDFLVVLHYSLAGGEPEEVLMPYIFEKDGQWYASFVLDHFSDFVMTEKVQPDYKKGDVNADGSVTAKDKAILNRYLAGWEGYNEYFE